MRGVGLGAVILIASLLIGPFAHARPAAAAGACDTPGAPTKTIYLPNITKTLGGPTGWVTPFVVQNIGTGVATLEVAFYEFTSGLLVTCRKITGLAPNTSFADVPNNDPDLPHDSAFSVVVRSFGSDAVAVVNEHQGSGTRSESLSYVGFTSGTTQVHLPYVPKTVGGWLTTFVIQNLGATPASVTAAFVSSDGLRRATLNRSVLPGRAAVVNPLVEPTLVAGVEYAVTLTSTQPIGVVANAHNDAADVVAPMAFSYNGTTSAGPADVYLPYVAKNVLGRSSRLVVQNAGVSDAMPTIRMTSRSGAQVTLTSPGPVAGGRTWSPDLRGVADGEHSAVLSGGALTALVITTDPTSAFGYTGQRPSPSRIFLPNVTRSLGGHLGWTTPLVVQSAGAASAFLRWYRFSDGQLVHTQALGALTPGAGLRVDPVNVAGLADNSQYAVVLDAPGPITALVLEFSRSGGDSAMAYEGFASAAAATPVPFSVTLTPVTATLQRGQTARFVAAVRDQFDAVMAAPPLSWSVTPATLGTIDANGLFTAGQAGGTGTVRVTSGVASATSGTVSATAAVTVQVPTTATVGGITFRVTATATSDAYVEASISESDGQTITASVDADVAKVQTEFSRAFAARPRIYVFGSAASATLGNRTIFGMSATEAARFANVNGFYDTDTANTVAVNWHNVRDSRPITTTRHELTHVMIQQIAGPEAWLPAWFNEGNARLVDNTVPGARWLADTNRYTAASAAAQVPSRLLPLSDLSDQEVWNARTAPALHFQYYEASRAAQFVRDDVGIAGTIRILDLMRQGPSGRSTYLATFEAAFQTVTGRSLSSFASAFPERLRTSVPVYPGIAVTTETPDGPGLHFVAYGFSPGAAITFSLAGPSKGTYTATADAYGVLRRYFTTAFNWIPGSYVVTVTESALKTATVTGTLAAPATGLSDWLDATGSSGLLLVGEDPPGRLE